MLFRMIPVLCLLGLIGFVHAAVSDFMLRDMDGVEHTLKDYKGKWVVVNYWATWCAPCVKEIPDLIEFQARHQGKNVAVIGVNMEEIDDKAVQGFLARFKVNYPMLLAEPEARTPLGEITALPTTFIVSPAGEVVQRVVGRVSLDELERIVAGKSASGAVPR